MCHGGQERIFEYEIDREGRNRYCNTYFVSPLLKNCKPTWSTTNAREIATCKQNVGQEEDFMHSNFQMDISLPWIDAAFT
jgi:hypothetical protein